jgi:hypothetical protein
MHKKCALVVPLMLALVGSISVVGIAHATNESSYQYGLKQGFSDYNTAVTNSADADMPSSSWDVQTCQHHVDNSTACVDGYIDGWKHWCKSDGVDCGTWAANKIFPSSLAGRPY